MVASELLRRQTGWEIEQELLAVDIADPAQFAERVVALYRDEALWRQLRTNALDRLCRENAPEGYVETIRRILHPVPTQETGVDATDGEAESA